MLSVKKIPRHLCFVCASAYPLFTDVKAKSIGGVQTRALRLAKLAARNFKKVTFAIQKIDGAKVINDHDLDVVYYEPAAISNAPNLGLVKIDADIYIVFESHYITADAVRTCNITNKVVVHWATSVLDYDKACTLENYQCFYSNWVGRESGYCIYYADYLISQTEEQRETLKINHGLESIVIRNPICIPSNPIEIKETNQRKKVLWVGRADIFFKRPEIAINVAKKLPQYDFIMIMNNTNKNIFRKINKMASENVAIIDYVPPDKISDYYLSSDVLLSTSYREGFSNVFLEAASFGLPIVSLEADPGSIFTEHGSGLFCNGDINIMVKNINHILADHMLRNTLTSNAYNPHSTT